MQWGLISMLLATMNLIKAPLNYFECVMAAVRNILNWSRAKLIMAMASIWPAALDVGGFDLLMENIYGRSDSEYDNIVGVI